MKLNEFRNKPLVVKRAAKTVININNDQMEQRYKEQISVLTDELNTVQLQLTEAARFRDLYNDQSNDYNDTKINLQKVEQQFNTSQQVILDNQQQIKNLEVVKKELSNERNLLGAATLEKQQLSTEYNDLLKQKDRLEHEKTQYYQTLKQQSDMLRTLNTGIEEAHNINNQLKDQINHLNNELNPLKQENPELKEDNYYLNHQLSVEKGRNKDALAKIEELEYLKLQLNTWTTNLQAEVKDTDSKKSAYQKNLKKKDKILAEVTKEVSELLQDREELQFLVQYYKEEAAKPHYGGGFGEIREAQIPLARDAVKRQYLGLGKPTLLKFKREDKNDNEE